MPRLLLPLTVVLSLALASPAAAVIVPDRSMAGVELGITAEEVIEILGDPDKSVTRRDFAGPKLTYDYRSRRIQVAMRPDEAGENWIVRFIVTHAGKERTADGVGVGTHWRNVRSKLDATCRKFNRRRICWTGSANPGENTTQFFVNRRGYVNKVWLGLIID
jgi:hypothetical protein